MTRGRRRGGCRRRLHSLPSSHDPPADARSLAEGASPPRGQPARRPAPPRRHPLHHRRRHVGPRRQLSRCERARHHPRGAERRPRRLAAPQTAPGARGRRRGGSRLRGHRLPGERDVGRRADLPLQRGRPLRPAPLDHRRVLRGHRHPGRLPHREVGRQRRERRQQRRHLRDGVDPGRQPAQPARLSRRPGGQGGPPRARAGRAGAARGGRRAGAHRPRAARRGGAQRECDGGAGRRGPPHDRARSRTGA